MSKDEITVYWWNFGKKTLDFKGSFNNYLLKWNITLESIQHPTQKDIKGWRFKIPLSSSTATLETFGSDHIHFCDDAIKIFLTLMGDRALLITPRGTYPINNK